MNRAAGFAAEELRLPPCVADAEATAIKARLDACVSLMRQHAPDLRLAKQLRCLWVVNGDDIATIALPADATPIVCVSASASGEEGHLQGAVDDEEAWWGASVLKVHTQGAHAGMFDVVRRRR